jgi:aminoglycoside phosphotransferase (APT) family kinase protein
MVPTLTYPSANLALPEIELSTYLTQHVPGFAGPLRAEKFIGGQSNPTYLIRAESGQYVLRRKPAGVLLASAHAVDREYRVLMALAQTNVPVPHALHLCMDDAIIGSAFYLMEYVDGRVFWDPALTEIPVAERAPYYIEIARVMAAIHQLNPSDIHLADFGKPGNYFARQLKRWGEQYALSLTEAIPVMDQLIAALQNRLPAEHSDGACATLVHGDFRVDNLMFHPTEPKIIAVMDWELSTLGDALSDAGYFCMALRLPSNPTLPGLAGKNRAELGIPSESEWLASYFQQSGQLQPADWPFYIAFNFFRLAAIAQGVKKRASLGNASNARANEVGAMVGLLAAQGLAALSG